MSVSTLKSRITRLPGLALMLGAGSARAAYEFNLQEPATRLARDIYDLHMLIFWICVVIGIVVFGAMFYSMYAHRKSRGAVPSEFHENTKLEFAWTIVPFLILVAVAVPATSTLLEIEDTSQYDMTVKITGMQWKWRYEYVDPDDESNNVQFIAALDPAHNEARALNSGQDVTAIDNYLLQSTHELVLPVNTRVRFLLTSDDVIHAWWVPQFGIKKDAIPGYVNEMWTEIPEPGVYRGQCAELCGKDHAFMPIVVRAVSQEDYTQWLAQKQSEAAALAAEAAADKVWAREELLARGEEIYKTTCAACHGPEGAGLGPFPPLAGSAVATGPVDEHLNVVLRGVPGTAMAAFGNQLNDLQLAAVITYERNALGNDTGDIVQPADVKAAR